MDKLPQEVTDRIAGYLFPRLASGGKYGLLEDRPGPAECATISRTWKRTIEAMTFRRLGVLSRDDIPDAKYLLGSDPHRRASVERIDFIVKVDDTPRDTQFHRMRDQKLVQEFRLLINFINEIWVSAFAVGNIPGSLARQGRADRIIFTSQLPTTPLMTPSPFFL